MGPDRELFDDVVDFDAMEAQSPALAAAVRDAETRSALLRGLLQMRKDASFTQKQVASMMATSQSFVSDLENGRTDPQLSTLQRYARAVGASLTVTASPDRGAVLRPFPSRHARVSVRSRAPRTSPLDRDFAAGLAATAAQDCAYIHREGHAS